MNRFLPASPSDVPTVAPLYENTILRGLVFYRCDFNIYLRLSSVGPAYRVPKAKSQLFFAMVLPQDATPIVAMAPSSGAQSGHLHDPRTVLVQISQ